MRKMCYLPVLSRVRGDALWFAPAAPGTVLVANHFGILEPAVGRRDLVRAQKLDLILLPLVGFDPRGNRLGMGAGFYDRTLAILRHRKHWRKPHLIGLAHELQRVDQLASDLWDIPLQAIVTYEQVYAMPKETNA
ncbi:MAG: 5-formyltetrahydrofolate cyclo-ligase [Nitrospira sp.]|nr:5-formyltetrahydrofolate cyclo-ligase [Nitrospira sp.]